MATTHGMTKSVEYAAWAGMIQRCTNPDNPSWKNYGGRGIRVCDEWLHSFEKFIAHIGLKPSPELILDRIDNDGDYGPGNIRWTTQEISAWNKQPLHCSVCGKRGVSRSTHPNHEPIDPKYRIHIIKQCLYLHSQYERCECQICVDLRIALEV